MKVLAVGGGSGGHVTPVVAVLADIATQDTHAEIRFWVDRKFSVSAKQQMTHVPGDVRVDVIASGKLRRYHHLPLWRQLVMPSIAVPNAIDMFRVACGAIQSLYKLLVWRPDVVFAKGGFVCLPVGWAAHVLRIPLVIHDSDTVPGLTNRILSRWAAAIGTGAPLEYYHYSSDKAHYVGIPVASSLTPASEDVRARQKRVWGFDESLPLVVVTGGGLGAVRINNAVMDQYKEITARSTLVLLSGSAQYKELTDKISSSETKFHIYDFIDNMPSLLQAADVVIARAGATTMAELAALQMPSIIIPNAQLTGGHQTKNAEMFARAGSIAVIDEGDLVADSHLLVEKVSELLSDKKLRVQMGQRLGQFSRPDAAHRMAQLIVRSVKKRGDAR